LPKVTYEAAMDTPDLPKILVEIENLRQEITRLKQANSDLEIAKEAISAHGDTLVADLQASYQKLEIEIAERMRAETALKSLLEITSRDKSDLQTMLELTAEHGDYLERVLQQEVNTAKTIATIDELTQIPNRRRFEEYISQEWACMLRQKTSIAFLFCDVDYFKLYNDYYGHLSGDVCLKQVAQAIAKSLHRPCDLVARYGGEEFAVILPNTNAHGAIKIAETIHNKIATLKIPHLPSDINDYITLSIGISATVPLLATTPVNFINCVDLALYQAKEQGRNCYVFKSYDSVANM